jgi:peptide/nickel transport system substrate-binding protein
MPAIVGDTLRARLCAWLFPFLAVTGALALLSSCSSSTGSETNAQTVTFTPAKARIGGRITVGTAAEADGFLSAVNRWSPSAFLIARAIFDPLATIDENGQVRPYLADSFVPNAGYTEWTIRLRPNVVFHDRSMLTSRAIVRHLQAVKASRLTGPSITPIQSFEAVDDLTAVIHLNTPWAHLPVLFASQLGFLPSPDSYDKGERPNVTASENPTSNPIGTGPFKFSSWKMGQSLVVERNPNYWQHDPDDPDVRLPYLSEIEFQPIVDNRARSARLRSGDLDVLQTDSYSEVKALQEQSRDPNSPIRTLLDDSEGAESSLVLNTQTGPFTDRGLRLAAAYAIDREGLNRELFDNFYEVADGPFLGKSKWANTGSKLPPFFPERARQLVDEWKRDNGGKAPQVNFSVFDTSDEVPVAQRIARWWGDVGFDVQVKIQAESAASLDLVKGTFDAITYRAWDRVDPDSMYHFWIGANVTPIGGSEVGLNFARYASDKVDRALIAARGTADEAMRRDLYQQVWDDFATNVPVIWLFHTRWLIAYQRNVHGIGEWVLPTGEKAAPVTWGNFFLTGAWLSP